MADVSAKEVIGVLAAQMRGDLTELLGKGGAFDLEGFEIRFQARRVFDRDPRAIVQLCGREWELRLPLAID
jgi:hypothetical protein